MKNLVMGAVAALAVALGSTAHAQDASPTQAHGYMLFIGAAVLLTTVAIVLLVGYYVLRIPYDDLVGVASGATGNPAILVYSTKMAPTERPDIGYAMNGFWLENASYCTRSGCQLRISSAICGVTIDLIHGCRYFWYAARFISETRLAVSKRRSSSGELPPIARISSSVRASQRITHWPTARSALVVSAPLASKVAS